MVNGYPAVGACHHRVADVFWGQKERKKERKKKSRRYIVTQVPNLTVCLMMCITFWLLSSFYIILYENSFFLRMLLSVYWNFYNFWFIDFILLVRTIKFYFLFIVYGIMSGFFVQYSVRNEEFVSI